MIMKLSENFSLHEFTDSIKAKEHKIDNTPNAEQIESIRELALNVLQPIRTLYGKAITINSGFRCEKLNDVVKGENTSQHLKGEAADITVGSKTENKKLFELIIKSGIVFDQLINESDYSWIHISYKKINANRKQILHL